MSTTHHAATVTEHTESPIQYLPLNALIRSDKNVRTVSPDKAADRQLIDNIAAQGLLKNLVVTPSPTGANRYEVIAGGRRWSSLKVLAARNALPEDHPVPCLVKDTGSAAATSLSENLHAPMHAYDQFMAFQAMKKEGMEESEIAAHFGLKVAEVRKYLVLANVHPTIRKAFSKDKITLDAVMAFTLTPHQKAQLAVFKTLGVEHCHTHRIREALTEESVRSDNALAQLVGLNAYEKAGGGVVHDLFTESHYLTDHALLVELAEKKLDGLVKKLKKDGWHNVTAQLTPVHWQEYHQVQAQPVGVPDDLTAALQQAEEQLDALDASDDEWTEEQESQYETLESEIERLEAAIDQYRVYSDEDKAQCQCIVTVDGDGKARIERGLRLRTEMKKAQKASSTTSTPSNNRLSQVLRTELGQHRQQMVQLALAKNPKLAQDVLLYSLCVQVLGEDSYSGRFVAVDIDDRITTSAPLADTPAYKQRNTLVGKLPTDWLTRKTPQAQFHALQGLSNPQKQRLLAYCVAQGVQVGLCNAGDTLEETVVEALAVDYRATWRPTAENYFGRLNVKTLLAHGRDFFSDTWAENHASNSKKELVAALHGFFNNPPEDYFTEEQLALRDTWLPDGFLPGREPTG